MTVRTQGLAAAHRGYIYQDLATAYFFAIGLVDRFVTMTVDRKVYPGDRFDDLTVRKTVGVVRRQFKSSENDARCLEIKDFTTDRTSLRIDYLVRSYKKTSTSAVEEYRLCATWARPTDPNLLMLLEEVSGQVSFTDHPSRLYRLRPDLIWPEGGSPVWKPLREAGDISRQDFVDFAAHFIIELECPQASSDLTNPGPLERLLFRVLSESIGVGRYPNQHRNEMDVAARLVQLATKARSEGQTLGPTDIEAELRLRTDYGRVAQKFALDRAEFVNRDSLQNILLDQIKSQKVVILTGGPGSGKSWILTHLAEELRNRGHLVARHYCYLEPGDPDVQRRVTTNVLFANLIAELVDSLPALKERHRPIYAAGPRELETLLQHAVELDTTKKVVLIIDGIDHISRVLSDSRSVAAEDTDIVEELAALNLPEGVCLVIGSQPGEQLNPLLGSATPITMPDWERQEIAVLADRLGVIEILRKEGFADIEEEFIVELHQRAEGNPLYATFLCRQILAQFRGRTAFNPVESLREAPLAGGNISSYYEYLFRTLHPDCRIIAEFLGLIDFGVTEQELQEIFPMIKHYIPMALTHLSPILKRVTAQGGVRIYHESFRRFIMENLRSRGGSVAAILSPVVDWLIQRGFYADSKAYRFLLPCLRRAGRNQEILEMVGPNFVSDSVAAGHPRSAIEANLGIAIDVAAEERDWPALARCAELLRSVHTCFEEKLLDVELYGRTFAAVFGAAALSERLLFDGQPTIPRDQGLILCSLCDDAGERPPWEEYLNLPRSNSEDSNSEKTAVAEFHGWLCVKGLEEMSERVSTWLEHTSDPPLEYLRGILRKLVQFGGPPTLIKLLDRSRMATEIASVVKLELARAYFENGDLKAASEVATQAVQGTTSVELAYECLTLGAALTEVAKKCPDLDTLHIGLDGERHYLDAEPVRKWVAGIGITAFTNPQLLTTWLSRVEGKGWYRAWLRFVILLSQAEVKAQQDAIAAGEDILTALRELASDTYPFRGVPRACDLYRIHTVIHDTISRALRLLYGLQQWEEALDLLDKIADGTTTYLQGMPGGPLIPEALIKILLPYGSRKELNERIVQAIERQVKRAEKVGEFYEIHATHEMYLSLALAKGGHIDLARARWQNAAVYLTAYGFRKDITIYELLESLPVLGSADSERTISALAKVQPLVDAVVDHTDGKETRHAPNHWFRALIKVDLVGGLALLARSLVLQGGRIDWRLESAIEDAIDASREIGNPLILNFLESTLPFTGAVEEVEKRLTVIERLLSVDPIAGEQALRRLAAQVQGDSKKFNSAAYEKVEGFAQSHGFSLPAGRHEVGPTETEGGVTRTLTLYKQDDFPVFYDEPLFPCEATPLDIMKELRHTRRQSLDKGTNQSKFVNALGYRLVELLDQGKDSEVIRLIRYWAREHFFGSAATPLAELAEGLQRHGYTRAACIAYALAYARSRGGGGWLVLGGQAYEPWLMHALTLSKNEAIETLAIEIAYLLHKSTYVIGITRHLTELCVAWGQVDVAFAVWNAAFEVINHRLPRGEIPVGPFVPYTPQDTPLWSLDEGLLSVLLARVSHPELGRKLTALSGLAAIIGSIPKNVIAPLQQTLRLDTPLTSILVILQTLLKAETKPYDITIALRAELLELSRSESFGLRILAQVLLKRAGIKPVAGNPSNLRSVIMQLENNKEKAILSLDWGNRIKTIANIWPQFPSYIAIRFNQLWEGSKVHEERARSRYKAAKDHVRRNLPPVPLLFWENELFECAFHDVLNGVDAHLWRRGLWTPTANDEIAERVLPHLKLHVAAWHSRVVRPPLPLPSEQCTEILPVSVIEDEDEYNGWYRCGYYEEELILDNKVLGDVIEKVTVVAGIVFPESFGSKKPFPLGNGNAEFWWEQGNDIPFLHPDGFVGPLVGLDWINDFLGVRPILMLPPTLTTRWGLQPGLWPGPLKLVDRQGQAAVVFRCWKVRPVGDDLAQEIPMLQGCELLVRPDLFNQLLQGSMRIPVEVKEIIHSAPGDY